MKLLIFILAYFALLFLVFTVSAFMCLLKRLARKRELELKKEREEIYQELRKKIENE